MDSCWASTLGDCGGKLSREHYVSACLFSSGKATVRGFPWCAHEPKTIGLQSLTRNILCEKHNNKLSVLDSAILDFFKTLRESDRLTSVRSKLRQKAWRIRHFDIDSKLLERWFLKTLINMNFRQRLRFGDSELSPGVPPPELVQIAFGEAAFEGHSGLYISARVGETLGGPEGVSMTYFTEQDALVVCEFRICGIGFVLSLVQEEVHEFQGSRLSHKKTDFIFRVPGSRADMVRSHIIHIR